MVEIISEIAVLLGFTSFLVGMLTLAIIPNKYTALWTSLAIGGLIILLLGGALADITEQTCQDNTTQEEHYEEYVDYNFCPNCGFELTKGEFRE